MLGEIILWFAIAGITLPIFLVLIGCIVLGLRMDRGAKAAPRFDDEETDYAPETPTLPPALVRDKPLSDRLMGAGWQVESAPARREG